MSQDKVKLVADIINRVGFPICACVYLGYLCLVTLRGLDKTLQGNNEALKAVANEISHLRK